MDLSWQERAAIRARCGKKLAGGSSKQLLHLNLEGVSFLGTSGFEVRRSPRSPLVSIILLIHGDRYLAAKQMQFSSIILRLVVVSVRNTILNLVKLIGDCNCVIVCLHMCYSSVPADNLCLPIDISSLSCSDGLHPNPGHENLQPNLLKRWKMLLLVYHQPSQGP